ncbi:MAG: multicopper oxidase domain-containing protein [Acidobacteriales bacterium]|nr:multicopper oxidase domain-containing protein [Terriglobales bacterium]
MRSKLWILITALLLGSTMSAQIGERRKLVLEPKATLKTEPAAWTHAPMVPAPITRKEQRRVVVNWEARETKAEIAPGVIYEDYWAFEGRVPGPVLRVREGDLVEVHLTNNITSMRNHNIDFHFVTGPGGGASSLNVAPGETAVLEARALMPGFYMFHCASPDIPTHIANGMFGFVIVEPAEGLPAADREYYVVQHELYTLNGNKGKQTFSMERGDREDAQYVVFNGAVGSTMGPKALKANLGETVRLWVGNAGPNYISSFHVIGQIFSNVYREGDILSPPGHGIQTTLIPAGGSAVVEFASSVPGTFLLVDHAIFRLHKGAAASIVIDGPKNGEVFDPVTAGAKAMTMSDSDHVAAPAAHDHAAPSMEKPAAPPAAAPRKTVPKKPAKPVSLAYPITSFSAASFPEELEDLKSSVNAMSGNVVIKMLPGAGNYNPDPANSYSSPHVTVRSGSRVTFLNTDDMVHFNKDDKGEFQTPMLKSGMAFSHVFSKPGVYHYTCIPHPWMKGTITVVK